MASCKPLSIPLLSPARPTPIMSPRSTVLIRRAALATGRQREYRQNRSVYHDFFHRFKHSIEHGLITYQGLPAPLICDYLSREQSKELYEPGTTFQIAKIEMVSNTGTYLDCPFHR